MVYQRICTGVTALGAMHIYRTYGSRTTYEQVSRSSIPVDSTEFLGLR